MKMNLEQLTEYRNEISRKMHESTGDKRRSLKGCLSFVNNQIRNMKKKK